MKKSRDETAYHEAGHAVIGRILTLKCGPVSIAPDHNERSWGRSITAGPYDCLGEWERRGKVREPDAVWHARIMCLMAGAEAEMEILGSKGIGDGNDREQIELMARELSRHARWDTLEPRLQALTRYRVRKYRALIERVAKALLAETTLGSETVDSLVGRSVDDVKVNAPALLMMSKQREP